MRHGVGKKGCGGKRQEIGIEKKSGPRKDGRKKGRGENRWGERGREIRDNTVERGRDEQS